MDIYIFFLFFLQIHVVAGGVQLAILHVEGNYGQADICAVYNPHYAAIPATLTDTVSDSTHYLKSSTEI